MIEATTESALSAAGRFKLRDKPLRAEPYGSGHINRTFCVYTNDVRYILQAVNTHVFSQVDRLMNNIAAVTVHLEKKVLAQGGVPGQNCLKLIEAEGGGVLYRDGDGHCWRVYEFVEHTRAHDAADDPKLLYHAGTAFGGFQRQLSDFDEGLLFEVIPDFHNTTKRYEAFERAVAADACDRAGAVAAEIAFVRARRNDIGNIVDKLAVGALPLRVTHNDTKLNNVLLDEQTGEPVCVIDLDTVMPGSVLYDFGDAIRFGSNTVAEDETDLSLVHCDLERFAQFAEGFLQGCGDTLTDEEISLMAFSARLMTLECGMRFLTDYLDGDKYFRIAREGHNLDRCRNQFKLAADMEAKSANMQAIIENCSNRVN